MINWHMRVIWLGKKFWKPKNHIFWFLDHFFYIWHPFLMIIKCLWFFLFKSQINLNIFCNFYTNFVLFFVYSLKKSTRNAIPQFVQILPIRNLPPKLFPRRDGLRLSLPWNNVSKRFQKERLLLWLNLNLKMKHNFHHFL